MKNKTLLLLPLFLLLSTATQCMEKEIIIKPETMHDIQNKRDIFKKKLDENKYFWWLGLTSCPNTFFLSCTYRQDLHKETYRKRASHIETLTLQLDEKWFRFYNIDNLHNQSADTLKILNEIRSYDDQLYSCLGSATMARDVSFEEIKQFIQKLLLLGFTPTSADKKLALLATYEEFGTSIIKKKLLLQQSSLMLQETVHYISLLMFNAEESLF